ncbi:hypothetical protein E3N88_20094 [Mikania micrantha]|uniref:Glabrous enhancer-binding protein-like DBD domain-containing protein n=1 Tax=Mikania micrantha TaxID=192012 RepID=A0A5N6NG10_9ASTR|nr:hypothetical protein E3N88_20094 [Mikania micrantha]
MAASGAGSDSPKVVKKKPSRKRSSTKPPTVEKNYKKPKKNATKEKPKKALVTQVEAPEKSLSGSDTRKETTKSSVANRTPIARTAKKITKDESKKLPFQRLWSEEDEIVILKGFVDFSSEERKDTGDFYNFIKKSIHIDVSRTQLTDKIRKLRNKYLKNARGKKDGKNLIFSKPHEQTCFELSESIWSSKTECIGNQIQNHDNLIEVEKSEQLNEHVLLVYVKRLDFLKEEALVALEGIRTSRN